jgi:hypothetical protein
MLVIRSSSVVEHRGQVKIFKLIMCLILNSIVKIEHWNASYARMTTPKKKKGYTITYFIFIFICSSHLSYAGCYTNGRVSTPVVGRRGPLLCNGWRLRFHDQLSRRHDLKGWACGGSKTLSWAFATHVRGLGGLCDLHPRQKGRSPLPAIGGNLR